jgi:hypothetical protein
MSANTIQGLAHDVELNRAAMALHYGGVGARCVPSVLLSFFNARSGLSGSTFDLFHANIPRKVDRTTDPFLTMGVKTFIPGSNINVSPTALGITQRSYGPQLFWSLPWQL